MDTQKVDSRNKVVRYEGREGGCSISRHPDRVSASRRLEHAHEGRGPLPMRFSLGIGWPSRVPYFRAIVLAFA